MIEATRRRIAMAVAMSSVVTLVVPAALAQYTPGSGGGYVPPATPSVPRPVQPYAPQAPQAAPSYSWETPQAQPAPVQIVQPAPAVPELSDEQLGDLTASIALYPDPLLAEMLPAATYVTELTYADRWMAQHPGANEPTIASLNVSPSVKVMMHYPTVLRMMTDHLDWTQALGAAFVYQSGDVMNSIQRWRLQAVAVGSLTSTPQQDVLQQGNTIIIVPPRRAPVMYVPAYDPAVVYVRHARPVRDVITFGAGGFSLSFVQNDVDWHAREVRVPVRHDRDDRPDLVVVTPPGREPPRGGVEARAVFVHEDARPKPVYPDKVVVPQPDHKEVVLQGRGGPGHGPDAPGRGRGGADGDPRTPW